jgi:hypothetical protein
VTEHECIDCRKEPPASVRKIATSDGEPKRCTSHLRKFTTRQRQQARASGIERKYDISAPDAGALLVYQGGKCWICRKATGASKALAVEHDHADNWVRGRLCSTCNQFITRQLGDDPNAALRLVNYLSGDTPYRQMLAARWVQATYNQTPLDVRVMETAGPPGSIVIWWLESGQLWNANYSMTLDELLTYAEAKRRVDRSNPAT